MWVLSVSLCDGGGVCAGGLSVGVSATNGRSGSRDPLLHCGLPRRKEKPGSVLLHTGWSGALGSRPPHAQRPRLQHEPERKAGPISLKPYLQRENASNFVTASRHTSTAHLPHLIHFYLEDLNKRIRFRILGHHMPINAHVNILSITAQHYSVRELTKYRADLEQISKRHSTAHVNHGTYHAISPCSKIPLSCFSFL